jgi:uncharacterized protein (TIGR03790 family)
MRYLWSRATLSVVVTYAAHSHRISALVVCRGVPLRLDHDPSLLPDPIAGRIAPPYRTNAGAVDAELSLLAQPNYPINGLVANPLYATDRPSLLALSSVVKVGRLDGPTVADAMDLVDRAVAAESPRPARPRLHRLQWP